VGYKEPGDDLSCTGRFTGYPAADVSIARLHLIDLMADSLGKGGRIEIRGWAGFIPQQAGQVCGEGTERYTALSTRGKRASSARGWPSKLRKDR